MQPEHSPSSTATTALLNMLQEGQRARHWVTDTGSGSPVVDKLYLNQGQDYSEKSRQHLLIIFK